MDTDTKYWNTKRAADYLGFSPDTLNRMRLTGEGPRYAKLDTRNNHLLRFGFRNFVQFQV